MSETQSIVKTHRRPAWYKRKMVVDSSAQLKVVTFLAGIATLAALAVCYVAYTRITSFEAIFNQRVVPPTVMPELFIKMARQLLYQLITIVAVMIFVFGLAGVFLTHKLAGPIFKLQLELKKFLSGQAIEPIKFRKGDEFQELPDLINKLLSGYSPKKDADSSPRFQIK